MNKTDLRNIPSREIVPGFHGKLIHTENMTIAFWDVEAGATLSEHAHEHEQVTNITEGAFELTLDGEKLFMKAGSVVVIPSNVKHSGKAITSCQITDIFHPVREDYR